jgi:cytochrome c oxidase subunit 2
LDPDRHRLVAAIGAQIYFMVKYKKPAHGHNKTSPLTHNGKLEFWWSAIPTVGFVVLFAWGEIDYMKQVTPPVDAIDVRITGQKWFWTAEYPDVPGAQLNNRLIVPVGKPMRLTMTSTDVIHSFFIPVFRLKKDVVPGRYTVMWFEATIEGEYPLFCTEYCGDQHSGMIGVVQVVSGEKYLDDPQGGRPPRVRPGQGRQDPGRLRQARLQGPRLQHLPQPRRRVKTGPTFKGLYGKTESITGGSTPHRRGQLHPRVRPRAQRQGRPGLHPADAELRRPAGRRADHRPHRVHQGPEVGDRSLSMSTQPANTIHQGRSTRIASRSYLRAKTGHLQQGLHAARRHHGVPVHHPGGPGGDRQHPAAADARGQGRRVPQAQPAELLPVVHSARLASWSRRPRSAASTPAGPSTPRTRL